MYRRPVESSLIRSVGYDLPSSVFEVEFANGQGVYDLLVSYRSGDVWAPKVQQTEALKTELDYFVDCIVNDRTPMNDGEAGLRVVRLLEAAEQSLGERGKVVTL